MSDNALYVGLTRIQDKNAQDSLRRQADAIVQLRNSIQQLPAPVAHPSFQQIKSALQANGSAPIVITGLPGVATSVVSGLHSARPSAASSQVGTFYEETDRNALYLNEVLGGSGQVWTWVAGIMLAPIASRPSDLGSNDTGFQFYATDQGRSYLWNGSAWINRTELGVLIEGTHAARSTAANFPWQFASGTQFYETDRTSTYVNTNRTGTVTAAGTAITWASGDKFDATMVGGSMIINGVSTTVTVFTDSAHVTVNPAPGAGGAYSMVGGKWIYEGGLYEDAFAARPSSNSQDMTKFDVGFLFRASDYAHVWRWEIDDAALFTFKWVVVCGLYRDTFANRPTGLSTPDLKSDEGFLFFATDRNHTWRWSADPSNFWVVQPWMSSPKSGVLSSITGSLGVHDVGYRYYATDFNREYTWQGAVWLDSPGQPTRGFVDMFVQAPDPAAGWHLCDGTAGVTISKSDGTTTTITVPAMNAATFPRGNAAYSGPTATAAVAPTTVGHTHSVSIANTLNTFAITGATGAAQAQTVTSGSATVVVNADGVPALIDYLPYMRL